MIKKFFIIILFIVLATLIFIGIKFTHQTFFQNTRFDISQPVYIYIDQNRNYDSLQTQLIHTAKINDIEIFNSLAESKKFPDNMRSGRYIVRPDDTAKSLLKRLQHGLQSPLKITFNNIRLKEDFVEIISNQLMLQNSTLLQLISDSSVCASYGFNPENIISMFIPNTYEVYWDTSPEKFLNRMNREYNKFWNNDRLEKAKKIQLTPIEVATLASIVEEECTYEDEYPIVAGLYLNRLSRNQLLQADPTLKFANGNFGLKRILRSHMEIESPYNTYIHQGLPPGPIRMPNIKAIDAVLNPMQHNYYYMCAKDDFSGRHNFAKTLSQHNENAAKYHRALNLRNIYR